MKTHIFLFTTAALMFAGCDCLDCKQSDVFEVSPTFLLFTENKVSQHTFTVRSSTPWQLTDLPKEYHFSTTKGGGGVTLVTVSLIDVPDHDYTIKAIASNGREIEETLAYLPAPKPLGSGIHAPPGVLGVNSMTGQLTLVGSQIYKNTSVATTSDRQGTLEFGPIANEDVYIVYFRWGGLVGVWSRANGDVFDVTDVAWVNPEYTHASTPGVFGIDAMRALIGSETGSVAWNLVPMSPAVTGYGTFTTDLPKGIGDPCSYAFRGTATAAYKMPIGASGNGGWNQIGATNNPATVSDWLTKDESPTPVALPTPGRLAGMPSPSWAMFLPAAGARGTTGATYNQGAQGYYWSHTAVSTTLGAIFYFYKTHVNPTNSGTYTNGFCIRCVPATP